MSTTPSAFADAGPARRHAAQRALCWLVAPFWVPAAAFVMRVVYGYRIRNVREVRARFRRICAESTAPLLVCANHLTMVDSFIVAWALDSPWRYLLRFDRMPWNTPEATNFARGPMTRLLTYLGKCIPIVRGGSRESVAAVLERVGHLLRRGEVALLFPEGGRSRTGRVETESAAWGVGRIVAAVPDCRVLCVYLRGDSQETWGPRPVRGEHFRVDLECIEPKSDQKGARRSRDLVRQVISQLSKMERNYFDARQ